MNIDISKFSKPQVLKALYDNAGPLGMGFLHHTPEDMTLEQAGDLIGSEKMLYFDYLKGRVMKVDISNDCLDPFLYDRDNGYGAAERAINSISK